MTPTQRLAEWENAQSSYYVTSCRRDQDSTATHSIELCSGGRSVKGTGATCDEAITAALDAWQKGDG